MGNYVNGIRSAMFEHEAQTNEQLIDFHNLMKEKLYLRNIKAVNKKSSLRHYVQPMDINKALHKKFLSYGTRHATSFIILDVDYSYGSINHINKVVLDALDGYVASWVLKTRKGYHIGFILDEVIFLNSHRMKKFKECKLMLSKLLSADDCGSLRSIGIWRNPLKHEAVLSRKLHNLDELHKHLTSILSRCLNLFDDQHITTNKIKRTKATINDVKKLAYKKSNSKNFIPGQRNQFLFDKGVAYLYNGKINPNDLEETLIQINNSHDNSLPDKEVIQIAKSIHKYNIKSNSRQKRRDEDYVHIKGKYWNDLCHNSIHNFKKGNCTEFARQKVGQKIRTAKVINKTLKTMLNTYINVFKSPNKKFTNENIVKNSNGKISKRTVQRYRNERELEEKIKVCALKIYLIKISKVTTQSTVKANVTPYCEMLRNLTNIAINEMKFVCKKTSRVFIFNIDEKEKVNIAQDIEKIVG